MLRPWLLDMEVPLSWGPCMYRMECWKGWVWLNDAMNAYCSIWPAVATIHLHFQFWAPLRATLDSSHAIDCQELYYALPLMDEDIGDFCTGISKHLHPFTQLLSDPSNWCPHLPIHFERHTYKHCTCLPALNHKLTAYHGNKHTSSIMAHAPAATLSCLQTTITHVLLLSRACTHRPIRRTLAPSSVVWLMGHN